MNIRLPFHGKVVFCPALVALGALWADSCGAQTLPFPGNWTGQADWVADGAVELRWAVGEIPTTAKSAMIAAVVSGPGNLTFRCNCTRSNNPALQTSSLVVSTGAGSRSLPLLPSPVTGGSTESVPLADGLQVVQFALGGDPGPNASWTSWSVAAALSDFAIVPGTTLADALDTTLSVTSSTWQPVFLPGQDFAKLAFGQSGQLSAQVSGPAVVSIRAGIRFEGSSFGGDFTQFSLNLYNPSTSGSWLNLANYNIPMDPDLVWGFQVPAGTHTLTWMANSGYTFYGDGITWMLDGLRVMRGADFAAALENNLAWTWGGADKNVPYVQGEQTHDGVDAVRLPKTRGSSAANGSLSAVLTGGPQLLSFWWKSSSDSNALQCRVDGAVAGGDATSVWKKQTLRLPAGAHSLQWLSAPDGTATAADGWLDQVTVASAFEGWLASYYTDAQLAQPGATDPLRDADGDGRPALMEFALQSSPLTASKEREPVVVLDAADPSRVFLTWKESTFVSGVTLTPESSENLRTWTALAAEQTGTEGTDRLMRAQLPASATGRSYARLKVQ